MSIEIADLVALDGPNAHAPQPGVLLLLRSDADRARRLRAALKDGAQSVGLVLGQLDVWALEVSGGWSVGAFFATPTPALGAALAEYVVDGLRALAAGDEEWDRDGPLFELRRRRRREAPPLPLLQMQAEARARDVPWFMRADDKLQLGYGARGASLGISEIGAETPAWEKLGAVPIVAITGGAARVSAMCRLAQALAGRPGAMLLDDAGFDEARALLANPQLTLAVLGLGATTLERRGAPLRPLPAQRRARPSARRRPRRRRRASAGAGRPAAAHRSRGRRPPKRRRASHRGARPVRALPRSAG